jgi:DNA-binding helix-hairpin-helix protein with protein kinase domain
VLAVPGFGPINSRPLLEWRQGLERKFVYDPQPNAVDHAVLGKVRADTAQKAAQLEMPLPRAIAEHRFAYSRQRNVGMSPPPGAVTLDDFPAPLAQAFETAFGPPQQATRPTAAQWVALLEEYEQSLRACQVEKLHHYSNAAKNCPWCRMEARLGVILFVPNYRSYTGPVPKFDPGAGGFDLGKLWAQIEAIKIPARSQLTPTLPQVTAQPSADARAAKFKREGYKVASYAAFVVAGLVFISAPTYWLASVA